MVQNESDFGTWVFPAIQVDGVPATLPPFFHRLVLIGEMQAFWEEVLDISPGALGIVRLG